MSQISSANVLTCRGDPFGGVTVNSSSSLETDFDSKLPTVDEAQQKLECSLNHWIHEKINGVWFEVDIKHSFWIPILTKNGFVFHHAQLDRVVLTKWLPTDQESTLPKYPFTNVGVGGVVQNKSGEILLMKERRGHYLGWKFPGGLSDLGESIKDAVVREVFEETGVRVKFCGILTFRHAKTAIYPNTCDLYFVCHLKPVDESNIDVKPCPHEAAAAQWMSRDDIKKLPLKEFHNFHHKLLEQLDKLNKSGRQGLYLEQFDPKRVGMTSWDMYYLD